MSLINSWFGYPIYATKLENFKEINLNILPILSKQLIDNSSEYSTTTDINNEKNFVNDNLHLDHRFNVLFKIINSHIINLLNLLDYNLDVFEIYITKSWATFSTKNQFIKFHRHMSSHYSFIYYPIAEKQGNVLFIDDEENKMGLNISKRQPYFKKWTNLNCRKVEYISESGNLIIFPSMLFHETEKNNTESKRISISGDILMTMKNGVKSETNIPSPSTWKKI